MRRAFGRVVCLQDSYSLQGSSIDPVEAHTAAGLHLEGQPRGSGDHPRAYICPAFIDFSILSSKNDLILRIVYYALDQESLPLRELDLPQERTRQVLASDTHLQIEVSCSIGPLSRSPSLSSLVGRKSERKVWRWVEVP